MTQISWEAVERSGRLIGLRETLRKRIAASGNAARLLDELFKNPYVMVARAEKLLKVSNPTARQAVQRLEGADVLHEMTGRSWGKLYLARPILEIIDAEESDGG